MYTYIYILFIYGTFKLRNGELTSQAIALVLQGKESPLYDPIRETQCSLQLLVLSRDTLRFKGMGSKMKPAFAFSQDVGAYAIVTNCERAWYLSASQSQTPCTSQGRNPRHVRWRDYMYVSDLAAKLGRKTESHMPFSKLQSVAFVLKLTNLSETTILTFFSRTSDTLLASCSLSVGSQWLIRIVSTCFE